MTEQFRNMQQPDKPTMGGPGAWVWKGDNWRVSEKGLGPDGVKLSPFEQHILTLRNQAGFDERPFFDGAGRPILEWHGSVNKKNVSALYERGAAHRESMIPGNRIDVEGYDNMRFLVGKVGHGLLLFGLHMHQSPREAIELMPDFVKKDPKVQDYMKAFIPTLGLYPYLDSADATMHLSEDGHGGGSPQLTVDDILLDWIQKEKQQFTKEDRMKGNGRSVVATLLESFEVGSANDRAWTEVNPRSMRILDEGAYIMRRDFSGRYLPGDPSRDVRAEILQAQIRGEGTTITRPPPAIS